MNTQNKHDRNRTQRDKAQQEHKPKPQARDVKTLQEDRNHQEHEHPEERLTR